MFTSTSIRRGLRDLVHRPEAPTCLTGSARDPRVNRADGEGDTTVPAPIPHSGWTWTAWHAIEIEAQRWLAAPSRLVSVATSGGPEACGPGPGQ